MTTLALTTTFLCKSIRMARHLKRGSFINRLRSLAVGALRQMFTVIPINSLLQFQTSKCYTPCWTICQETSGIGLIPHGKKAQRFISTYTVPDEWRILEPPLRTLLGRASNDEKDRVKRFCQRMIPMKPPERRNLESLQVNSKNSKESHQ